MITTPIKIVMPVRIIWHKRTPPPGIYELVDFIKSTFNRKT